jgi:hypothetical protein
VNPEANAEELMAIGKTVGRKAAKVTWRHTVHGFAAKAKRQPLRSVSLLSAGGVVGAAVGFFAGRKASDSGDA